MERPIWLRDRAYRDDFELWIEGEEASVRREFSGS